MRDTVFISHATPEDNEFTLWLTLKLHQAGYRVWCDLTGLLGGERWWNEIEELIRKGAAKFVYVLSRTSNHKTGPRKELQLADNVARKEGLHNFIIPAHIDDLPYDELNIQVNDINAIVFDAGWAQGLDKLLKVLEKEAVPKDQGCCPDAVTNWWRQHFDAERGLSRETEEHVSNWLAITALPKSIYLIEMKRSSIGRIELPSELTYPAYGHNQYAVSFASMQELMSNFQGDVQLSDERICDTTSFLDGASGWGIDRRTARNILTYMLKQAWLNHCRERGMSSYALANGVSCSYFKRSLIEDDQIRFKDADDKPSRRQIVGYRTKKRSDEMRLKIFWHIGVDAKPVLHPLLAYMVRLHVLFSDDGENIWDSKPKLHSARRRQCKDWWNDKWRGLTLATSAWLAGDKDQIVLPVSGVACIEVASRPLFFTSPVRCAAPECIAEPIVEDNGAEVDWEEDDFA